MRQKLWKYARHIWQDECINILLALLAIVLVGIVIILLYQVLVFILSP